MIVKAEEYRFIKNEAGIDVLRKKVLLDNGEIFWEATGPGLAVDVSSKTGCGKSDQELSL